MRRAADEPRLWERLVAGIRPPPDLDAAARDASRPLSRLAPDARARLAADSAPCRHGRRPARAAAAELQGLVDNATPDRLYGWAWNAAGAGGALDDRARLGDAVVATPRPSLARPDLAKAGIGDGCHAFEIPLDAEWIAAVPRAHVVARAADGSRDAGADARAPPPCDIDPTGAAAARDGGDWSPAQRQLHEDMRASPTACPRPPAQEAAVRALVQSQRGLRGTARGADALADAAGRTAGRARAAAAAGAASGAGAWPVALARRAWRYSPPARCTLALRLGG